MHTLIMKSTHSPTSHMRCRLSANCVIFIIFGGNNWHLANARMAIILIALMTRIFAILRDKKNRASSNGVYDENMCDFV